jgi:hypothetical protein
MAMSRPVMFFGFVFTMMLTISSQGAPAERGVPAGFIGIMAAHVITMLWVMGLTVFYIVDVFRNELVVKDQKALWAVVIFLGSFVAMPIYWYLYIWREPAASAVPGRT